jgi:hypothetical protein
MDNNHEQPELHYHFKNHDGECLTDMKSTYEITDNKVNLKGEMLSHYNVDMDKQFKSLKNITNLQSNIKLRFTLCTSAINAMTSVTLYIANYLCKPKAVEFLSAAKADKVVVQ